MGSEFMRKARRDFLLTTAAGIGATALGTTSAQLTSAQVPAAAPAPSPDLSAGTFAEASKLMQVEMSLAQCAQAASSWKAIMPGVYERRTGPRKVPLAAGDAPYSTWNPVLPGQSAGPTMAHFVRSAADPGPVPKRDADIAFAPLTRLARWVERRELTSERLTRIYLARLETHNKTLRCVITLTPELALAQAKRADTEIAAGHYRGPLHGIPWGGKDLLDTKGIATTYGAEVFRDRVPTSDAAVVQRLEAAGAVLVAKLSLGALALNDVWFGGQTMNPWLIEEGSSGSSAGPGSATAAGLVGFSIGSETGGSIVSPSMRCGITGLRPTYGRVPRTGAMTLCWSLDKLGPMTRTVEDSILVLNAIHGADAGDLQSVDRPLSFDANTPVAGLRVGYVPAWMQEAPATDVDRAALDVLRTLGMVPAEISLPDWPYNNLNTILFAEGAASFEELTLSGAANRLRDQSDDAWPNTFRQARFLSAVDFVQADRLRRRIAAEMVRIFSSVDLLLVPSMRDEILSITNATGHPSLTMRAGFVEISEARSDWLPSPNHPVLKLSPPRRVPHGITLIGKLFDEGTIVSCGLALERHLGLADRRPAGF
jgi:Asp-tRNA(Asn)/Glu-tRNA(Gln) amidotransferase A subunit family amidase